MVIKNFIIYAVLLSFNLLASNALAESSVWKVSKGENYFYLGGTLHLLTAADYPLPDEFIKAYKDANTLIFETDLRATQTPEFQSKFLSAIAYKDDRTLSSELKPDIYNQLENFLAARQIPIASFSNFQPWGISLVISVLEYQRLGMTPEYGVDMYFNNLALADNKEIISLETPDEQLSFLISMARIDPNLAIESTLRDLDRLPAFIELMRKNWRDGDLEAFAQSASIKQMEVEFPEIFNTILTNRNNNWMKQLPAYIDDSRKEFVLVGALHLSGKKGLLNQLIEQGFKVEQL